MGAMASKKASSVSPVSFWMAADSAGEVSGPVAMMTLSHSAGGRPATSPRSMATRGCSPSRRVTSAEKWSRSTASAPPAGSLWASPAAMISEPARRISSCSRPTALVAASSERKLLEQTSSASPSVLCASVCRSGPHLVQHHRQSGLRDLPRRLAPGQAAADDVDGLGTCHDYSIGAERSSINPVSSRVSASLPWKYSLRQRR